MIKHNAELHHVLTAIIAFLEADYKVVITNDARTVEEHVEIYKNLFPDDWFNRIPWGSRHLPSWETPYLRAIDINVFDGMKRLTGDEIKEAVMPIIKEMGVKTGLGIGKTFLHIDIRNHDAEWRY